MMIIKSTKKVSDFLYLDMEKWNGVTNLLPTHNEDRIMFQIIP